LESRQSSKATVVAALPILHPPAFSAQETLVTCDFKSINTRKMSQYSQYSQWSIWYPAQNAL